MKQESYQFELEGLRCGACVGRAEKAILSVAAVKETSVNLANSRAQISGGNASEVLAALRKAGYPARQEILTLSLSGLHCASCVAQLEKALMQAKGVVFAQVNLATSTAQIEYVIGLIDVDDLIQVVKNTGYSASLQDGTVTDDTDRFSEVYKTLLRQVWIATALVLPVFVIEMGGHLVPAFHHWVNLFVGQQTSRVLQFFLISLLIVGPGRGFYAVGLPNLMRGHPDMNSLVALGTGASFGYSTLATFFPGFLPNDSNHVYFESAGVIIVLILLGRAMEARAKGQTGAAIRSLIGLRPASARVQSHGTFLEVPIEDVAIGDVLQLRPGDRVAVDGKITEGQSYLDESMITGEPIPVSRETGDMVIAGTINGAGGIIYRATAVGKDTVLAQIIAMVERAQGDKLPIQGLVDRITARFVPLVLLIAFATVMAWLVFAPSASVASALVAGVSVLIIACPCAMGLATPTSIMVGTGRAAELGVLFRKGDALQQLAQVSDIAFDKTGTLTEGKPVLTDYMPVDGVDAQQLLRLIGAAEMGSEHPIATAIADGAAAQVGSLPPAYNFRAEIGSGIHAVVEGKNVQVGNAAFMTQEGIDITQGNVLAEPYLRQGVSPIFAAVDGVFVALMTVADRVKLDAATALKSLKDAGLETIMITGDIQTTANLVADTIGISSVEAGVPPAGKVEVLQRIAGTTGTVAFVGDGINDAPALAVADVGIAFRSGTDVAIESADVVLMSSQLQSVVDSVAISRATMRNIRQNLGWAFGYNVLLIPVAAGILVPFGGPQFSPMLGAAAMALSSVFVVSNALRLKHLKLNKGVSK
ncbi:MAG: heavy metal translocating P-type ATPase [Pseudoruegeria sp.]